MTQLAPISQQIWDMKYRLKGLDGHPVDKTLDDSWRRVAKTLSAVEADPEIWEERFFKALQDFKFLPAGRILSGAGSGRRVTLFNCFVMGDIPDDMAGIFDGLKEAALTMQQGGGIGYDFSTLRPKGAAVHRVGSDASGPLSFMDVWDAMCRTIMSAGSRRGAMMAVMRCDHPDIEAFIEAKREPGRLRMFNLSVLVTDAFMQAVKEDAPWELMFDGTTYKSLPARALWDKIMRATYAFAEPGVIFIDRINRMNNLSYCETIHGTNPCVTADTWVQTTEGPRQVGDLVGKRFRAVVDGAAHESGAEGFFPTGIKPVVRLRTDEGLQLRLTNDHRVRVVTSHTRYKTEVDWRPAGELKPGDEIVVHDHRVAEDWDGPLSYDEGYLAGFAIASGAFESDDPTIAVETGKIVAGGGIAWPGQFDAMQRVSTIARDLGGKPDSGDWTAGLDGWSRLDLSGVAPTLKAMGISAETMQAGRPALPAKLEKTSAAFQRGFLRAAFDALATIDGNQRAGISIRLSSPSRMLVDSMQRMLARFGIVGHVFSGTKAIGTWDTENVGDTDKATHRPRGGQFTLTLARENVGRYQSEIGFDDTDKRVSLGRLLAQHKRKPNRERFVARVASVLPDGRAPVFDVKVPGVNAFDANGLYVHNCGEQPLPPYGACLLGSVNLAKLVTEPFTEQAAISADELTELVGDAVRMMDNVIDVSNFPLEAQAIEARAKRRIGLGITGLADALIMCGARYGSTEAVALTEMWLKTIERAAYLTSVSLAKEKGSFPLFDAEAYLAAGKVATLDDDVRAAIAEHGIRNALLTSVAPTGTISLFADNVSSGLEPVFSFNYTRSVLMPDGERRDEEVSDYAFRLYRRMFGEHAKLTNAFVDAQGLTPGDHVVMQAAVQKYIDSSISKTINVPESIAFDDFKNVYIQAYDLGCKGCTTYRPNDVTGSVLSVSSDSKASDSQPVEPELPFDAPAKPSAVPIDAGDAGAVVYMTQPLDRPEALPGATYKVSWPESEHALYITLNDIVQDGRRRPFEIFINSKNMEHYAWTVGLTRMISAVFRRGGDVSFVVEELKAVFDPRGGHWMGGRYVPSLLAALGEVIERHMLIIGFLRSPGELADDNDREMSVIAVGEPAPRSAQDPTARGKSTSSSDGPAGRTGAAKGLFRYCPKCNQPSLMRQEGCDTCTSCGYSKCG